MLRWYRDDTNEQNITVGGNPAGIVGDTYSHKIYVTNPDSNTVTVIDGSNRPGVRDTKEPRDIAVGQSPNLIAINSQTRMIYVTNSDSHSVSVINGFSSKVAAGVTFNVNPVNSGTIWCGSKEYPTNIYIYVDNGTNCRGQGKNNFEFDRWVQNLNRNSSLPLDEPSGNLTVNRYGTFTANFKPVAPPIPPEYSYLIISVIVSSIIGWSVPSIFGWFKARKQLEHLEECINLIDELDKNAIEDKIKGYYVHGKISEDHRQFLKDKISEYYDSAKGSSRSPV
jgi:YVTN family beta-propeller protein